MLFIQKLKYLLNEIISYLKNVGTGRTVKQLILSLISCNSFHHFQHYTVSALLAFL